MKYIIPIIILLIFIGLSISFPKIENFEQKINCDQFMSMYGNCNNFLDTIYNGGIPQTHIVKQCQKLCYEKSIKY